MVEKNTVGALVVGMLIGAALLTLAKDLPDMFSGEDDVSDDLEALENGTEELDDLVAELNNTLAEALRENQLVHSELAEWIKHEEGIMTRISGLPLLERKDKPTREELHCYAVLAAGQDPDTPSLDAVILEWENQLNTMGDDAQLANIDLQNTIQKQQQIIQLLSNISKLLHDTAAAVVRKIG